MGFTLPIHLVPVVRALVDERIRKLMIIVGPGSGKSMLLSQVFPSWILGHDPTMTIIGISAGEALIQGFVRSVMETIEWSPTFRTLFPKVRPDKSAGWSTERGLFVTGRHYGNPDANYSPNGLESKSLTGRHGRLLVCDDLHDTENSASQDQCLKVKDRYYNTIIGRADPRGARFVVAGRRWNQLDLYAHLMEDGDFVTMVLPAERPGTDKLYWDVSVPDGVTCIFNESVAA
jgi:hypothetical protein